MTIHVFEHREVGPLACNCYVVGDPETREAIVVDPGGDADDLAEVIARHGLTITAIVATHAHFDHLIAAERLREVTGAPFHLHDADKVLLDWYEESALMFLGMRIGAAPEVDTTPDEGDRLVAGSLALEVVHTPGHSPGSISLVADDAVFSGDTLFAGSIGRSDLPGGDGRELLGVIRSKLFALDEDVTVYPGHGPATTIGAEKVSNPFVGQRSGLWVPGD